MSSTAKYRLSMTLKREIDGWIKKFPKGKQASAVIMALRLVQNACGHLRDKHIEAVASYLKMPTIQVHEVARFYTMFYQNPVGKHVLKVCNSISCHLRDSQALIAHLEARLSVGLGDTTSDGVFTIQETECLGACCQAPCMLVNDHEYHYDMSPEKVDALIQSLEERV